MSCFVPICPPGLTSALRARGFPGDEKQLDDTISWLGSLEVNTLTDFNGLESLRTSPGVENLSPGIIVFLENITKVCLSHNSILAFCFSGFASCCQAQRKPAYAPPVIFDVCEEEGSQRSRSRSPCNVARPQPGLANAALELADTPQFMLDIAGCGPNAALNVLTMKLPREREERLAFRRQARIAAVLGSCPKTRASFRAGAFPYTRPLFALVPSVSQGIRNWIAFIEAFHGGTGLAFPAELDDILLWSHNFRCVGTFMNYMGYLRTASVALGVTCPAADHPALKHAKIAVLKRMLHTPRCFMFPPVVHSGRHCITLFSTGRKCSYRQWLYAI